MGPVELHYLSLLAQGPATALGLLDGGHFCFFTAFIPRTFHMSTDRGTLSTFRFSRGPHSSSCLPRGMRGVIHVVGCPELTCEVFPKRGSSRGELTTRGGVVNI